MVTLNMKANSSTRSHTKLRSTPRHWDAYWAKNNLSFLRKVVEELSRTTSLKGGNIIEIGAGGGATSIRLAKEGAKVVCLDYSQKAVSLIAENARHARVDLMPIRADASSIPFADNTFDVCFHQGLLEHFRDPRELLREQYRVLKDNGIILIDVPQRYSLYTLKKRLQMRFETWFAGWETEFSAGELAEVVSSVGFKVVRSFGRYHFRNLDRIQQRLFKRTLVPPFVENLYYRIICRIENSRFGCCTAFSLGIVARKKGLGLAGNI